MATRKKSSSSSSTSLTKYEEQLAARIRKQQEQIRNDQSNIVRIDPRDGFVFNDVELGKELKVVVLGSVFENTFFSSPFDPNAGPVSPVCWAIGELPTTMAPPVELTTKVSDQCSGCPKNEFGSRGAGKACRNGRRVAIVPWTEEKGPDLTDGIGILRLAPTSLAPYNRFLTTCVRQYGLDTIQCVTKFEIDDTETFGKIKTPQVVETIPDPEILGMLLSLPIDETLNAVGYSLTPEAQPASTEPRKRRSRLSA
jgi:hypothetical protein